MMPSSEYFNDALLALFVVLQVSLLGTCEKTQKCKDHDIKLTDEDEAVLKKCLGAIGAKSVDDLKVEMFACFAKCLLETAELTDAEGKPHKENIMKSIDEAVSGEVKEAYKKTMDACLDKHGPNLNPKDETCASYTPLVVCTIAGVAEICGIDAMQ